MYLLTTPGEVDPVQVEAEVVREHLGGHRLAGPARPGEEHRDPPAARELGPEPPPLVHLEPLADLAGDLVELAGKVVAAGRCRPSRSAARCAGPGRPASEPAWRRDARTRSAVVTGSALGRRLLQRRRPRPAGWTVARTRTARRGRAHPRRPGRSRARARRAIARRSPKASGPATSTMSRRRRRPSGAALPAMTKLSRSRRTSASTRVVGRARASTYRANADRTASRSMARSSESAVRRGRREARARSSSVQLEPEPSRTGFGEDVPAAIPRRRRG